MKWAADCKARGVCFLCIKVPLQSSEKSGKVVHYFGQRFFNAMRTLYGYKKPGCGDTLARPDWPAEHMPRRQSCAQPTTKPFALR